jgi:hypothetical protein
MKVLLLGFVLFVFASPTFGQKQLDVKIVDRKDNSTDYSYVIPARFTSRTNSDANCSDSLGGINCSGSSTTTGSATPATQVSYQVRGSTFSLQLPVRGAKNGGYGIAMLFEECFPFGQEAWRELDLQNGIHDNPRLLGVALPRPRSIILIVNSAAPTEPKPSHQICEGWSSWDTSW